MLQKLNSITIQGLNCERVEVEADILKGLTKFAIVGLGDAAVQESKERVRSAIKNSNFRFPNTTLAVNLAPADLRKKGPLYDLPIALGLLLRSGQIEFSKKFLNETIFLGELSLSGKIKHVPGVLPVSIFAKENGFKRIILAEEDAKEAAIIDGIEVLGFSSLEEIFQFSIGEIKKEPTKISKDFLNENEEFLEKLDFKHIKGQEFVKRALEISAAGSHNVLMNGAPGSGKTLMARALQTILPKMSLNEALEVTKIYSVANKLEKPLLTTRPFRTVHHTASSVSIVGGGNSLKPGEISLAHRGILFLDEFAEFPSNVLEVLRQPIEDKKITISRASGSVEFPAQFTLVAAMNPCYCGYYNVPNSGKDCSCSAQMISKYQKKISGPLLDRIDLYCDVSPVKYEELKDFQEAEGSKTIRERVQKARDLQTERFKKLKIQSNSEMSHAEIKHFCQVPAEAETLLDTAIKKYNLSARSIHRVLKTARTIADLAGNEKISFENLAESLQYRAKIGEN